jgi:hypothetical protein
VRPIAPEERDGFRLHLQRHHYLGFKRSVGESIAYAAFGLVHRFGHLFTEGM